MNSRTSKRHLRLLEISGKIVCNRVYNDGHYDWHQLSALTKEFEIICNFGDINPFFVGYGGQTVLSTLFKNGNSKLIETMMNCCRLYEMGDYHLYCLANMTYHQGQTIAHFAGITIIVVFVL